MKKSFKVAMVMAGFALAVVGSLQNVTASVAAGKCDGDRNYDCGETKEGTLLYGTWTEGQVELQ